MALELCGDPPRLRRDEDRAESERALGITEEVDAPVEAEAAAEETADDSEKANA